MGCYRRMFLEKPFHEFASHAADEFRDAPAIEDLMDNNGFVRVAAARCS